MEITINCWLKNITHNISGFDRNYADSKVHLTIQIAACTQIKMNPVMLKQW